MCIICMKVNQEIAEHLWARVGSQIFYQDKDKIKAVSSSKEPELSTAEEWACCSSQVIKMILDTLQDFMDRFQKNMTWHFKIHSFG